MIALAPAAGYLERVYGFKSLIELVGAQGLEPWTR